MSGCVCVRHREREGRDRERGREREKEMMLNYLGEAKEAPGVTGRKQAAQ